MERGATLQIRPGLENVCLIYKEVWFAGQVFIDSSYFLTPCIYVYMYKWNPSVDEVSPLNLKLENQKQSLQIQG